MLFKYRCMHKNVFHRIKFSSVFSFSEYAKSTAISFSETFGDSFIRSTVTSLDAKAGKATLANGRELQFTHLIVATGSEGHFPARTSAVTINHLFEEHEKVAEEVLYCTK